MAASMSFLDQLHALHGALHLSHVPAALPGREEQHGALRDFLTSTVDRARGGSIYISGAPGVGKTASVEHVVHQLYGQRFHPDTGAASSAAASSSSGPKSKTKLLAKLCASSPPVRSSHGGGGGGGGGGGPLVLYTNAMAFASKPSALYPRLLSQLRGLSLEEEMTLPGAMACMEELQQVFCPAHPATIAAVAPLPLKTSSAANKGGSAQKKKSGARGGSDPSDDSGSSHAAGSQMTLIVLDEVDALLRGPNAAVLYHLLEWPARPNSRLVVVAISNLLNLLEQRLPELARRNALPQTLIFTTYDAAQLKRIAMERCESIYPPERPEGTDDAAAAPAHAPTEPTPKPTPEPAASSPVEPAAAAPARSSQKRSASVVASLSIASLSETRPVLRSSPRTAPHSGTSRAAAEVVVRSVRGRKRKQDEEEGKEEPKEEKTATEDEAISADPAQLLVTIRPLEENKEAEHENIDPADQQNGSFGTPKKKRARPAAVMPRGSAQDAAASAAADAPPTASPAASSPRFSCAPSPLGSLASSSSSSPFLISPSTRSRPIFSDHSLDFLCLKVSKGSGDLRKVLEIMRKCVDGLLVEAETLQIIARNQARDTTARAATVAGRQQPMSIPEEEGTDMSDATAAVAAAVPSPSSPSTSSPFPAVHPSLQVSLPLMHGMVVSCMGGSGEQTALLRSLPVQQKVLLAIGALLCHLHGGKEQLHAFPKYYARFSAHFKLEPLRGADFADLLAALAAHRLIKLEAPSGRRRTAGGSGGSGRSAPASGGGGSGRGSKALGSGSSGALGAIQVNVSLESLTAAFDSDPLMQRLLDKGKALATSILAATRAASEIPHKDYELRNVEDP